MTLNKNKRPRPLLNRYYFSRNEISENTEETFNRNTSTMQ